MHLVVVSGNTHTQFYVFENNKILKKTKIPTQHFEFPFSEEKWDALILCSVVPQIDSKLECLKIPIFKIHSDLKFNFFIDIENPSSIGADRLSHAAYAVQFLKLPALVIDFGTAITMDVINADKKFLGGVIMPSSHLIQKSMAENLKKVFFEDLGFPNKVIGKNTTQAVMSGTYLTILEAILGLTSRIEKEVGKLNDIIITGGASELFFNHLFWQRSHLDLDLTALGALTIYQLNCGVGNYGYQTSKRT